MDAVDLVFDYSCFLMHSSRYIRFILDTHIHTHRHMKRCLFCVLFFFFYFKYFFCGIGFVFVAFVDNHKKIGNFKEKEKEERVLLEWFRLQLVVPFMCSLGSYNMSA